LLMACGRHDSTPDSALMFAEARRTERSDICHGPEHGRGAWRLSISSAFAHVQFRDDNPSQQIA
jgi:hypothetical protein